MQESKTTTSVPIRFTAEELRRLDAVSAALGTKRATLVRLLATKFCEQFELRGRVMLPPDWEDLLNAGIRPTGRPRANGKGDYPEHREQFSTAEERPSSPPDPDPKGRPRRLNMIHPRT